MFSRPNLLRLLNGIIQTIQLSESRKCFRRGPHVGQPW